MCTHQQLDKGRTRDKGGNGQGQQCSRADGEANNRQTRVNDCKSLYKYTLYMCKNNHSAVKQMF